MTKVGAILARGCFVTSEGVLAIMSVEDSYAYTMAWIARFADQLSAFSVRGVQYLRWSDKME